jgi:quercetin dioxygenase-like cupin family protein
MTLDPLIVRPADRPQPLNVLGTSVTVLADNARTGGLGLTSQHGAAGTGPSAHCHPWDEAFYILEGSVEFTVGEETSLLEAGSLVVVPGNTVHAFHYGPGGGKMIEVTGAGSNAASMFKDFAREMPGEPDLALGVAIMARHGATLLT